MLFKKKWTYRMTYLKFETNLRTVSVLKELGAQGWELVMMKGDYGIFKKPY